MIMHNLRLHSCFSFPIKLNLYSEYALNNKDGAAIALRCCGRTAPLQAAVARHCFFQKATNNVIHFFSHIDNLAHL